MASRYANYEGTVPAAKGTGPRNLAKTPADSMPVRRPAVRPSRADGPSIRPGLANPGFRPPAGAGSGIAKAATPMAATPRTKINRPKTGSPSRGRRLPNPRADFPARI